MKNKYTIFSLSIHIDEKPNNSSQLYIIPTLLLFRDDLCWGFCIIWLMFSLEIQFRTEYDDD
jgi:hypothetical protein